MHTRAIAFVARFILAAFFIGIMAACTPQGGNPPAPTQTNEALVSSRVTARWDALIQRDFGQAYGFTTPEYRKGHTKQEFTDGFGRDIIWKRMQIKSVALPDPASAKVTLTIYFTSFDEQGSPKAERFVDLEENWIFTQGDWFVLSKGEVRH